LSIATPQGRAWRARLIGLATVISLACPRLASSENEEEVPERPAAGRCAEVSGRWTYAYTWPDRGGVAILPYDVTQDECTVSLRSAGDGGQPPGRGTVRKNVLTLTMGPDSAGCTSKGTIQLSGVKGAGAMRSSCAGQMVVLFFRSPQDGRTGE
jgi:hypothetical protein